MKKPTLEENGMMEVMIWKAFVVGVRTLQRKTPCQDGHLCACCSKIRSIDPEVLAQEKRA